MTRMAPFQTYLAAAVMATLFTATCGFSKRSLNSAVDGGPKQKQILGQKRDKKTLACRQFFNCFEALPENPLVSDFLDMNFEAVAANVSQQCSLSNLSVTGCTTVGCEHEQIEMDLVVEVIDVLCEPASQEKFTNGIACWNNPEFHTRMHNNCWDNLPDDYDMPACYQSAARELKGCTEDDASFVRHITQDWETIGTILDERYPQQ